MWPFKKEELFWEERFEVLATYNSEIGRGIVHTKKFDNAMAVLQNEYNKKMKAWADKNSYTFM